MPIKKSYADHGDACASAHGIELIGDVWAYPVVRELFLGPKRFSELAALLHGITPAVLTARLRELQAKGLVQRADQAGSSGVRIYQLTPWGHALERPLEGLAIWAQSSPTWNPTGGLTPDASILAMKTMSCRLDTSSLTTEFRLTLFDGRCANPQDYTYLVRADGAGLAVERESSLGEEADMRCDSSRWAQCLFDPASPRVLAQDIAATHVAAFVARYRASLHQG